MKKAALHNLGCKVNSYEMDVIQQMLIENGYQIVAFDEFADIYIVNTCTVTNIADRKSRQMLHRAKQKNPDAIVVAVGCYVQARKDQIAMDPGIDLAIGNNRKKDLVKLLEEFLNKRKKGLEADGESGKQSRSAENAGIPDMDEVYEYEEMTLKKTAEHARAYIKIQDGCNQFCSYCAIPLARGRVRSRPLEDIVHEIQGMVTAGYQEIVLTGIHISSYGIDFDKAAWQQGQSIVMHRSQERRDYSGDSKLIDLIEKIHEIPGLKRIRLGSLEPRIITEETAGRLAALPKVCPHFHLSLQSGCDQVLLRMNRHYTTEEYYASVTLLRKFFEHPAITTDVIVGFPGETEEEFAITKSFLKKTGFYEMHIFKFSKRSGTRAAVMPGQLTEAVKGERSNELLTLNREQSAAFRSFYLGQTVEVLLEERKELGGKIYWLGHTPAYLRVAVEDSAAFRSNLIVRVGVRDFLTEEILTGDIITQ